MNNASRKNIILSMRLNGLTDVSNSLRFQRSSNTIQWRSNPWIVMGLALGMVACHDPVADAKRIPTGSVRSDFATIGRGRIFFGHQSVGENILSGLETLASTSNSQVRILNIQGNSEDTLPGIFHERVGQNEDPNSKCEVFLRELSSTRKAFDIGVLKFCYVDLNQKSLLNSPQELFDLYLKTVAEVKRAHPNIALVYTTIPLEADPYGWKTRVKRWLGKSTWKDGDNEKRAAYNQLIRSRFGGPELFDIAKLESTYPNGERSGFHTRQGWVETLAWEYSTDGGHLNALGQKQVALGFLSTLSHTIENRVTN